MLIIVVGCKKDPPKTLAEVSTTSITNITSTSATSGGTIIQDGNSPVTSRGVCWGTNQNPTINDSKTSDGAGIGTFISSITGLSPGGTYYVRAYATNAVGTAYGVQITIITTSVLPVLTTTELLGISSTTATGGGNITSDGGATVIARGVCWSRNTMPTVRVDSTTNNGTGIGVFTSSITGLSPGGTYYIRAYATNSVGIAYGNQLTASTNAILPVLSTTEVSAITTTTAISGGNITNDGGAAVTARGVCWSTSQNPTTSDSKTSDGSGTGIFTSSITGLSPGGTYYIRAYATNSIGTSYGNQVTFSASITLPTISTTDVTAITSTTGTSGGNITNDGGAGVTARGVCWSKETNPTIADSKTSDGTGTGSFTSSIEGLSSETTYYLRAYATNCEGTAYGTQLSFNTNPEILFNPNLTYGKVTDIEGNVYKTIDIGTQTWMAENLKTTKLNDNTSITHIKESTSWNNITSPGYGWYLNYNANKKYGAYYNSFVVNSFRICPSGWHLPSDVEWKTLVTYLGGDKVAGDKLKESGTIHWGFSNSGATNSSGFTGIPVGIISDGEFTSFNFSTVWWSSDIDTEGNLISWGLRSYDSFFESAFYSNQTSWGFSVRCLKGESYVKPIITTTSISSITLNSAISGGHVTSDGGAAVTSRGVCWSKNQNPTVADSKTSDGTGTGSFTSNISGLSPATFYYLRAYATNSVGTTYGNQISFSTPVKPIITTTSISSITLNSAISGGHVTSDGGAAVTSRGVCWSKNQNPTVADSKTSDGTGTGSFTSNISGLSPATFYYLRAYATNSVGTTYGNQISFSTKYSENSYADGSYKVYQNNTQGQYPCEILFIGDGYIPSDFVEGGLFDQDANKGIEAIFSVEPYKTYRNYFKIYKQAAYSKESGVTQEDKEIFKETCFSTKYFTPTGTEYSARMSTDYNKIFQYAEKIHYLDSKSNMLIVLIVNQDRYDGVCYVGDVSIGVCPVSKSDDNYIYTNYINIVLHEAAGHGWGKLADEYIVYTNQTIPEVNKQNVTRSHEIGWGLNIDITNNLKQIIWKHFINKSGYEKVGAYEGAEYYSFGVWKPEYSSCMVNNMPYYNAPSREAIVKRIMEVSGGIYSFDNFVVKDTQKEPSSSVQMLIKSFNPLTFKPLPPPITVWWKYKQM